MSLLTQADISGRFRCHAQERAPANQKHFCDGRNIPTRVVSLNVGRTSPDGRAGNQMGIMMINDDANEVLNEAELDTVVAGAAPDGTVPANRQIARLSPGAATVFGAMGMNQAASVR